MPIISEEQLIKEEHQKVLDSHAMTESEYKKDVSKTSRSWFAVSCNPHLYGYPFESMVDHYLYNQSLDDTKFPKIERTFIENDTKIKRVENDEERYQRVYPELLRQYNVNLFNDEVKKMLNKFQSVWIVSTDNNGNEVYSTSRAGAFVYCISAKGLHHVHMILEDSSPVRWASIRNSFPHINIQPTRGSKKEVEDYINKVGKFEEKGEIIVDKLVYGEIYGKGSGHRTDLDEIQAFLDAGQHPRDIITMNLRYSRYSKLITQYYLDKKYSDFMNSENTYKVKNDPVRSVDVHWLFGSTGVGKTNYYRDLCKKYGFNNVYRVTNYKNPFDKYMGEEYIFFDEFRGEHSIDFNDFLLYIDNVVCTLPCRFNDKYSLYSHIYICSPYLPQECYSNFTDDVDNIDQLMRRITDITYLYKDKKNTYQSVTIKVRNNHVIQRDTFFSYSIDSATNRTYKKREFITTPFNFAYPNSNDYSNSSSVDGFFMPYSVLSRLLSNSSYNDDIVNLIGNLEDYAPILS